MLMQRFSKPVQVGVKVVLPNKVQRTPVPAKPSAEPAVGPELDKALDEFVADKPKSIMKDEDNEGPSGTW